MLKDRNWLVVSAAVAVVAGGCTLAPKYNRPAAPVPSTLPSGPAYPPAPAGDVVSEISWQEFIADARLEKLIRMALENNRDLRIATLNVQRAQALYGVQRAELLPTLDANASMSKQRLPAPLSRTDHAVTSKQYQVGLGAAWEIDFFGRIRSLSDAALQQFLATQEARRGAQILLVSSVANAYLSLAADRQSLQLARTTFESQQGVFELIQRRYDQGIATQIDVQRAQQQVESARVDIARYTQIVAQDENALNLLAGTLVPMELQPVDLESVIPPRQIAAGVSSEALLQRPDVLQAEYRLRAANANIGVARAAFFPRISLTGAFGTASGELSGLFKSGSETWTFSPQITMPIFDPRVWSAAKVSKVDQEIALADYERAIQTSFRDVADVLAVYGTVDQQVNAQESLVRSVAETYRLSNVRYAKGLDSYLNVLDAQRSLYGAQQALVSLRLARLANQVTLYAALGGGWKSAEDANVSTNQPSR